MPNMFTLNGAVLNGSAIAVITGSGVILSIEESVVVQGSGLIISVEQAVNFRAAGAGTIIIVEQNVETTASGLIISVEQNVIGANPFLARNGYDCTIFIGGYEVPKSQITDNIYIKKDEGKSSSLQFTILPPPGLQDPESFQGQPVVANLTDSTGTYRAFTGFIDTPTIDLINQRIMFDCTDRRDTRILELNPGLIDYIGVYSIDVFGQPKDQADELDKRLSTVPVSFDFDNYGNPQITEWQPKSVPDFTLSGDDIYYDKPTVAYVNRTKTLNTVYLTVNYHFQRLHQQLLGVTWSGYDNFLNDWFNQGTPSFPRKDMIQSAAFSGQWKPLQQITFVDLWPAGGFGGVQWQPNQVTNEYKERTNTVFLPYNPSPGVYSATWPDGRQYPLDSPVLDSSGKKVYDVISTTITDTSSMLCRGATWAAGLKFAQNVIYTFQITIESPQAVDRFGVIQDVSTVDVTDAYDTSLWEQDTKSYYADSNFFLDKQDNYLNLQIALDAAFRKARTSILSSHRQTAVTFRRRVWAAVDLTHTVETTATQIACKGKVASIAHTIDCTTGQGFTDVSLLLSRSFGGDTDSEFVIPSPIDDPSYIGLEPMGVELGTHLGQDPNPVVTPGADKWNGFIGNKSLSNTSMTPVRTQFSESFIVDYPAVSEALRGDRNLVSTTDLVISIPNDELEVEF